MAARTEKTTRRSTLQGCKGAGLLDGLLDHDEDEPRRPLLGDGEARALVMLLAEPDVTGQREEIRADRGRAR
ncbi:hypothetical protein [Streptomyces sp. NPDC048603]|uniref:hypothetical protein n=1 Tax=Streptomyces sp. NPDC048603 TaxID=3365577 RepID=UPI003718FF46